MNNLNQLPQAQDRILKTSIDLVNEKEWWKAQALKLAKQNKQCYLCLSPENWNPKTLTCQECQKEAHA